MINFNANVSKVAANAYAEAAKTISNDKNSKGFDKTMDVIKKNLAAVDDNQRQADQSVADLLSGRNQDITSVVSSVAKADMSFKLLVGVRNKLIEAYQATMNMGI